MTGIVIRRALWIAWLVLFVDQLSKYLATRYLDMQHGVNLFPGFDLVLRHNSGAAFNFLADAPGWQRWFLIIFAIFIIIGIIYWLSRLELQDNLESTALALILGGALGNLWDRIVHGYVIDFILIYYKQWSWPAFNIADSAICIGVVLLILDIFKKKK